MQKQHGTFQIQSIARNISDNLVQDGASQEIINLRKRYSDSQPIGKKKLYADISNILDCGYEILDIKKHPAMNQDTFIVVANTQLSLIVFKANPIEEEKQEIINLRESYYSTIVFQNMLIVNTTTNRYDFLYDQATKKFKQINIPEIDIEVEKNSNIDVYGTIQQSDILDYGDDLSNITTTDGTSISFYIPTDAMYDTPEKALNAFYKVKKKHENDGYFEGHTFIRTALKMKDGSYINYSPIIYLGIGNDKTFEIIPYNSNDEVIDPTSDNYDVWEDTISYYNIGLNNEAMCLYPYQYPGEDNYTYGVVCVPYGNYNVKIQLTDQELEELKKADNFLESICIFQTKPIPGFDIVGMADELEDTYQESDPQKIKRKENISEKFAETVNFYKMKEINISELEKENDVTVEYDINIETLPTLPVNDFANHTYKGKPFIYNNRLHLYDVETLPFPGHSKGYSTEKLKKDGIDNPYPDYIDVDLNINGKIVRVRKDFINEDQLHFLPEILSYPDARATQMILVYEANTAITIQLKKHDYLNLAYFIKTNDYPKPWYCDLYNYDDPDYTIISDYEDYKFPNSFVDTNRVQVSEFNNPFMYPAKNSYRFGDTSNKIIALETITRALSPGQFGQFPVYTFTEQGIFVMEQGSGEVLYSNIRELNKEVPLSANSVINTGKGVIFATHEGLKILSGDKTQNISLSMMNETENKLINNQNLEGDISKDYLVDLYNYLDNSSFQNFLSHSIIEYDYFNDEIVVSNNEKDENGNLIYNFSFVYNLKSGTWHKITQNFENFINLYPTILAQNGDIIYYLTEEQEQSSHCLIQTRAIKLGSQGFKQLRRLAVRGHFEIKSGTYASAYLYGSKDGINYKFLRGKRPQDSNIYDDFLIDRTLSSFRYLIVVIAGQFKKNTRINSVECIYNHKYTNKLR